jgi:hypothetical protein
MTKLALLVLVLCLAVTGLRAQDLPMGLDFPLDGVPRYRDEIPKPEMVLGHRVGDRHTQPHQIAAYFRAIAQVSDRVQLVQYARSYQGQPLIYAIVTSPPNHQRLERIRQQTDPLRAQRISQFSACRPKGLTPFLKELRLC